MSADSQRSDIRSGQYLLPLLNHRHYYELARLVLHRKAGKTGFGSTTKKIAANLKKSREI